MIQGFEKFQKVGRENVDFAMKNFGTLTNGLQTIAVEYADYSRKSFEDGAAALERLAAAKSFDKAVEVQTDYVKSAYEGFIAQATKMGELYADLAKSAYQQVEAAPAKTAK